jgi:Fic family protein
MPWNWELSDWPNFRYDFELIAELEKKFLLEVGSAAACLKNVAVNDRHQFVVEILSEEGLTSSKIEGEILDRASLQSSIQRHFGIQTNRQRSSRKEKGMAELLCRVYDSFDETLTDEMLFQWHALLFPEGSLVDGCGKYRTHAEPMQIVSARLDDPRIFFEAPPSRKVPQEMARFIQWFNQKKKGESILGKAAIAHVYFESIHPFEDGNGRIGRALVEKILSQCVGRPTLIAVSKILEARKKEYYAELERCNRTLDVQAWVDFFGAVILQAQTDSLQLLYFLIAKAKMLSKLSGQINERQEKVLLRMFAEGVSGFKGGLSAENYISIAKVSRATATRDLFDLVQKGALIKTGELRYTRYALNISQ